MRNWMFSSSYKHHTADLHWEIFIEQEWDVRVWSNPPHLKRKYLINVIGKHYCGKQKWQDYIYYTISNVGEGGRQRRHLVGEYRAIKWDLIPPSSSIINMSGHRKPRQISWVTQYASHLWRGLENNKGGNSWGQSSTLQWGTEGTGGRGEERRGDLLVGGEC